MVRMSGCRINKNNVTHRIIDGETVMLATGWIRVT